MASASGADVRAFLTRLVVEERLGVAAQNQALNALLFYFRQVEAKDLGDVSGFAQARRRVRMPVVLSRQECDRLFDRMEGTPRLMAE